MADAKFRAPLTCMLFGLLFTYCLTAHQQDYARNLVSPTGAPGQCSIEKSFKHNPIVLTLRTTNPSPKRRSVLLRKNPVLPKLLHHSQHPTVKGWRHRNQPRGHQESMFVMWQSYCKESQGTEVFFV